MNIKKALLLSSMVLAVVAFAIPATASAETTITDNGQAVTTTVTFSGAAKFSVLGTGIQCTNVHVPVTVDHEVIEIENFIITNPTTECDFEGAIYSNCEFEEHPTTTGFPLVADLATNTEKLTITSNTTGGTGRINAELKSKTGKNCIFTTNDITILHNAVNSVTVNIETNATNFITSGSLTGTVKVDRGAPGGGTTISEESNAAVTGKLHIAAASQNTFKIN